jgi:hypothetical protein
LSREDDDLGRGPKAQLKFVELSRYSRNPEWIGSVGVEGCGRKAVYVLSASGDYVANTVGTETKKQ